MPIGRPLTNSCVSGVKGQCRLTASLVRKSFVELDDFDIAGNVRRGDDVIGHHAHPEGGRKPGRGSTDPAEADDPHRQAGQFDQRMIPVAEILALAPTSFGNRTTMIAHIAA